MIIKDTLQKENRHIIFFYKKLFNIEIFLYIFVLTIWYFFNFLQFINV